jgi:hypothetical protein
MDHIKDQTLVVDVDIRQFIFGSRDRVPKEHEDTKNPENGVTARDRRRYIWVPSICI